MLPVSTTARGEAEGQPSASRGAVQFNPWPFLQSEEAGAQVDAIRRDRRDAVLEAYARQELPFEILAAKLAEEDAVDPASLIQVYFILQNAIRRPFPVIELTPQQRRQRTLEALSARMEALTRASPVLIIFEDVHWIDATTLEVLGRAMDQIQTLRMLLIVTFRPEFDPPWIGRPYVAALTNCLPRQVDHQWLEAHRLCCTGAVQRRDRNDMERCISRLQQQAH